MCASLAREIEVAMEVVVEEEGVLMLTGLTI